MNFTVQFSSPFFAPYMLNELKFSVEMLGIMTAITILAKIVSYPYWGRIIDRFTNRAVLIATAFMVPLIPLIWLFSKELWVIAIAQAFSGFIWAGFDLAVFNSALSFVGRELRPAFISKYNSFAAFANGCGALAGALFLANFGTLSFIGFSGIMLVFLISGVARMVVALVFVQKLTTKKEMVNKTDERTMIFRLVAVYPTQGAVHQVVDGFDFTRKIVASGAERGRHVLADKLENTERSVMHNGEKFISFISRKKKL